MIFDCHNDILTTGRSNEEIVSTICGYKKSGRVVCALWTSGGATLDIAANIKAATNFDFAVEDMSFYDERDEERLLSLNPLYCSLTWNRDNRFAGGASGSGGLTESGGTLVRFLENNGIKIDTAHLNRKSFFDVADRSERIFCSHASIDELCPNPRNLTDEQIGIIVECGGIVGLTPINKFNSLPFDETIDFFVQKYGIKSAAIGSDFFGSTDFPSDLKNYADLTVVREKLERKGYKNDDLDLIFFGNAAKFFSTV